MALHVYWPATACLTLFVVGVIILLLRYGPRYCKVRHTAFADDVEYDQGNEAYEQRISYA